MSERRQGAPAGWLEKLWGEDAEQATSRARLMPWWRDDLVCDGYGSRYWTFRAPVGRV